MKQFEDIYQGRSVLVTGHTGFKGSWLSLWLHHLGAMVTGVGLDPNTQPNHWDLLQLPMEDRRLDLRDFKTVNQVFKQNNPEIVFHLAAQPLVRRSYRDPLETWSTNVMGTANVLEACRHTPTVKAIVVITTDKCYENREWPWGYRETDTLGGHDPYSASKAGAELVVASYRSAFFPKDNSPLVVTARAGNVIGGGDWSEDRLIPDLVRSVQNNKPLEIRSPRATRPWQHVLESLSGYLLLGKKLLLGDKGITGAWNFGPDPEGNRSVAEVLSKFQTNWPNVRWYPNQKPQPHEANLLYLDSSKAKNRLGWQPVWNLETTISKTTEWYRVWLEKGNTFSRDQLAQYIQNATEAKRDWAEQ